MQIEKDKPDFRSGTT